MTTIDGTCLTIWQPEFSSVPKYNSIPQAQKYFYINIILQESTEDVASGWFQYERLLDPESESSDLHYFVTYSYTELQSCPDIVSSVVRKISAEAQKMATDPSNAGHNIIPLSVLISVDEEDDEDVEEESMYGLEEVTMEELEDLNVSTCAICLERLHDVVARTSCNHVYHPTCIYTWLDKRNTCPTCRYEPVMYLI